MFCLGGSGAPLQIQSGNTVGQLAVTTADLTLPRFYEFMLPGFKLIAAKSRNYSEGDRAFIKTEVGGCCNQV